MKKRGLGRGLDALLGVATEAPEAHPEGRLRVLPVESLRRGVYQPRQDMRADSLDELAASIRAQGVVQPIVVRPLAEGGYEIIAGERRWRAAQLAGLTEVPTVVREVPDQAVVAMALIENIQREDLNPLEEAAALQRLIAEFDLTHQQAADAVGRSRAAVSNLLRLLELCEDVQALVRERRLEMGHARALLPLPASGQREAARQVLLRGLTVRETEQLVRNLQLPPRTPTPRAAPDPNVRALQQELSDRLGARVQVVHAASGKGRVVIHYGDLDELDGILAHVR